MANPARGNPQDLVKAFQKVAKELGCNQSEQRFQEVLVAIGRYKPAKEFKAPKVIPEGRASTPIGWTSLKDQFSDHR